MGFFDPKLEFIVNATNLEPPAVTVETIQAALEKVRRVVICSTDVAEQLAEEVKREGLSGTVKVISSEHLEPRTAFILQPGALADQLRETGSTYTERWIVGVERGDGGMPE